MSGKMSRRIVVDADVAKSAGTTDHPTSKRCREFLQEMLVVCHKLVLTPPLEKEWRKHRSRFTSTWQVSMESRGKIIRLTASATLGEEVAATTETIKQERAVRKDMHLIDAAISADKLVASKDKIARQLFANAVGHVAALGAIAWVNPDDPAQDPIGWLKAGARSDVRKRLGTVP